MATTAPPTPSPAIPAATSGRRQYDRLRERDRRGSRSLVRRAAFRYFGRRPLIEDDSVTSRADDARRFARRLQISQQARLWLDILNLFNNTGAHQIDYFYPSQFANESGPVYHIHFKPVGAPRCGSL